MNVTHAGCLECASQSNDAGSPVPVDPLTPVDPQIPALDPTPPHLIQHQFNVCDNNIKDQLDCVKHLHQQPIIIRNQNPPVTGPVTPVATVSPASVPVHTPVSPAASPVCTPVQPATPLAPVSSPAPVTPVCTPVSPVQPATPVAPVSPAASPVHTPVKPATTMSPAAPLPTDQPLDHI